jgi:hypothetical protein
MNAHHHRTDLAYFGVILFTFAVLGDVALVVAYHRSSDGSSAGTSSLSLIGADHRLTTSRSMGTTCAVVASAHHAC